MSTRSKLRARRARRRAREESKSSGVSTLKLGTDGWFQLGAVARNTEDLTQFSAVFQCINLIADDVSKLNIRHVRLGEDGIKRRIPGSPIIALLRKPNAYQSRVDLIKYVMTSMLWHGNGYLYGLPDRDGAFAQLHALNPFRVTPMTAPTGEVFYTTSFTELELPGLGRATSFNVPARDMLHHRTFVFRHPLRGISPLYAAAASSLTGQTILEKQHKFFERFARPGGMLKTEKVLNADVVERIKKQLNDEMASQQIGRTLVLEQGLDFVSTSIDAQHSQLIETMNFSVEDVARAFKVPTFMLGNLNGVSYNNAEQLRSIYYGNCLQSHIEALEARLWLFFDLPEDEAIEFDLDQLLRAETAVRYDSLGKGVQHAILTVNEARHREGLPPVEGGDNAFMQEQMRPVGELAKPKLETPAERELAGLIHQQRVDASAAALRAMLH